MLPILLPGTYEGEGTILQNELGSVLSFKIRWEVSKLSADHQIAQQTILIAGAEEPVENSFTFYKNGHMYLINSVLGEAKGKWVSGENFLSWELNAPPLFEGFEVIRVVGDTLLFHAEYLSSASRNEIKGALRKAT